MPEEVLEQTAARFLILFGLEPSGLGIPAQPPLFTVQLMLDRPAVIAPALNEIESSKEAKGQLWVALKQLFGI